MSDYQALYQQKTKQCEELTQQFNQFQQQSNLIINDLQQQIKQLKRKNQLLNRDISDHKEKNKCFKSSIQRQVQRTHRQRNEFKKKFQQFEKKVIELQIVNETLQNQLRATQATLSQYQSRTERTMQQLAMAQLQMQQTTQNNKQVVARLRGQLKEAEEELFALQKIRQKKEVEKERQEASLPSQIMLSEITPTNTNVFKEALKEIREYLDTIQSRKQEARKMVLLGM